MNQTLSSLSELYRADETAWLDTMAELLGASSFTELDYANLREYLRDMANRDRRRIESRLKQMLLHVLKWEYQAEKRTRSWKRSIINHRQELARDTESGVLRTHAEAILPDVYGNAIELAAAETGLPPESFPSDCPYSLDELLAYEVAE